MLARPTRKRAESASKTTMTREGPVSTRKQQTLTQAHTLTNVPSHSLHRLSMIRSRCAVESFRRSIWTTEMHPACQLGAITSMAKLCRTQTHAHLMGFQPELPPLLGRCIHGERLLRIPRKRQRWKHFRRQARAALRRTRESAPFSEPMDTRTTFLPGGRRGFLRDLLPGKFPDGRLQLPNDRSLIMGGPSDCSAARRPLSAVPSGGAAWCGACQAPLLKTLIAETAHCCTARGSSYCPISRVHDAFPAAAPLGGLRVLRAAP